MALMAMGFLRELWGNVIPGKVVIHHRNDRM
jgi:hypothetical protein